MTSTGGMGDGEEGVNSCKSGEDERVYSFIAPLLSVKAIRARKWTAALFSSLFFLFFFLLFCFLFAFRLDEMKPKLLCD